MASERREWLGLAGWIGLCFLVAALGAVASAQAKTFYGQLAQPVWAPPPYLFGPVWSVLYLLMAIAAWLVWCRGGFAAQRIALWLFIAQLLPNALWSWLFFAWQQGALAFLDIALLWSLIAATAILFYRTRPLAGVLLVPYLAWVTFASALNLSLWQLNPQVLGT